MSRMQVGLDSNKNELGRIEPRKIKKWIENGLSYKTRPNLAHNVKMR